MPKHLVLGGGLEAGIVELGALAELTDQGKFDIQEVETVHATSAGAFAAVLLVSGLSTTDVEKYIVDRPWNGLVAQAAGAPREPYTRKGLLAGSCFRGMFSSVLRAVDLEPDATLGQLAAVSTTRLRLYTVDADRFELVVLSSESHPELEAWRAVHMSAAYPLMFEPAYFEGRVYVDGGILCNFPIAQCLDEAGDEGRSEVLCLRLPTGVTSEALSPESDASTHAERIVAGLVSVACPDAALPEGVACLELPSAASGRAQRIIGAVSSKADRRALAEEGRAAARDFLLLHCSDGEPTGSAAQLHRVDLGDDSAIHDSLLSL